MFTNLTTEKRNNRTMNCDKMPTEELLQIMNDEDAKVTDAIQKQIPLITKAVNKIVNSFKSGGRLIYIGAGTSGRIGLLDAVECPPTFGTDSSKVIGLIAGGEGAFIKSIEGAEDNKDLGIKDLRSIKINSYDTIVGIAASGRTPYVVGGLNYANSINAETIAISGNLNSEIGKVANIAIEVDCGPEVLTGSTRLKAGTAQKLICNMLSTASMVGIGKTYGNLMVDLELTNEKLEDRAKHIVMEATSCDHKTAAIYLEKANNKPKIAIIMLLTGMSYNDAVSNLQQVHGFVYKAINKN